MSIRTTNTCCGNNAPLVEKFIGTAYDVVKAVYDSLGEIHFIYEFLNKYGVLICVTSKDELKALPVSAKYARIYNTFDSSYLIYTDYLYVENDTSGIIPNESGATGSWIVVGTSSSSGNGGGSYIPYVYKSGSALGGEITIAVPNGTVGVPFIIVNGYMQSVGYGFQFSVSNNLITLSQALEKGDEVVLLLSGTPAVPDNPNIDNWTIFNWLYNEGAAVGGETTINIPYTFQDIPAVFKNGLRFYKGLQTQSYFVDANAQTITLTEPLVANDRLIIQIGGEQEVIEIADRTIQEVARVTNVKNSEVILSTNTSQVLDNKTIIYSVDEQKIYRLPTALSNVYISTVADGKLTYTPGNVVVILEEVITGLDLQDKISNPDGATLYPDLQIARWKDEYDPRAWGIVGNGVTDDTSAFEQLESDVTSKVIDMDGKVYATTKTFFKNIYINGTWLINGKSIPMNGELLTNKKPAWDVYTIGRESNSAVRFIPIAQGRGQIRTLQTFTYDPVDRAYYSNHNTEIDGNATTVSIWNKYSADSRIINSSTDFMLPEDRLGHQGIAVQNLNNAIKLWTTAPDTPAGSTTHTDFDFSVGGSHGIVRFSWRSNTDGEIDAPELFRVVEETRTAGSSTTPTISLDGKWLIVRFTDNADYNNQTFRIFSTDIFDTQGDYSSMCTHEFTLQLSQVGGDETTSLSGFCSDGSHLYMYCGNITFGQTQYLSSCDLLGNDVRKAISDLGDTDLPRIIGSTPTFRESEGMHFVDYDGVLYPSVTIVSEHSDVMGATRRTILIYALGAGDKRTLSLPSKEICISDNPEITPHVIYSGDTTWGENSPVKALKFNNQQGTGLLYEWQRKGVGYFQMYMSTSNVALMAANGADLHLGSNDTWRWKVSPNGHWHPYLDNSYSLGVADNRPTQVYAVSGTINTSDEREKTEPVTTSELSSSLSSEYDGDAILDAWGDVRIIAFRWLSAIKLKNDAARWHFGVIAQQVRDAFLAHGLDGTKFGLLCYDEWEDSYEPVLATRKVSTIIDGVETEVEEEYDTGEKVLVREAGNRWGIRADQCLWLEAAYLRRRLERIEERLSVLESSTEKKFY